MHLFLYIVVYRNNFAKMMEFQTEIQGSLTKLSLFKVSNGHPSKMAKLPIMASGAKTRNT